MFKIKIEIIDSIDVAPDGLVCNVHYREVIRVVSKAELEDLQQIYTVEILEELKGDASDQE